MSRTNALTWALYISTSFFLCVLPVLAEEKISFTLRTEIPIEGESLLYQQKFSPEDWSPNETAVIICDMWDSHTSVNAFKRVGELAPRVNSFVKAMREKGVFIIHAPSDCMDFYKGTEARQRAIAAPQSKTLPKDISKWCHQIESENQENYPIEQKTESFDETYEERAAWKEELKKQGRTGKYPWKRQIDVIQIDQAKDAISDQGVEVWNLLSERKIKNVILVGVHTNMCVLGRPFGLRQMAQNGKNVVLVRDLTDTMYSPRVRPFVSHFSGTDLIISYIERYVCPTISSEQVLAGKPFRFKKDDRPSVVMIMAEREYKTKNTLTKFAQEKLQRDFKLTYLYEDPHDRNAIVGIDAVKDADVLVISVRRRTLPKAQLSLIREFVASGKPMLGIRTASHPFSVKGKKIPDDRDVWDHFDSDVWSGNYNGHYGASLKAMGSVNLEKSDHPVLAGVSKDGFPTYGSLYKNAPLPAGPEVLLYGKVEGEPKHPVAWTYTRKDKGKSFYTSLGHEGDFSEPNFVRLLTNAFYWAVDKAPPQEVISAKK